MQRNVGEGGLRRWRTVLLVGVVAVVLLLGSFQQSRAQSTDVTDEVGLPDIGEGLFDGRIRFDSGAPSCAACHSNAGISGLGGGSLGPDLTGTFDKFGEEGLTSILATTPFPTMRPVYRERPLTPQEQTHLAAFLKQAAVSERPTSMVGLLALLGALGASLLLLLTRLIWRQRLTEVRRPMVARSRERIDRSNLARREMRDTTISAERG